MKKILVCTNYRANPNTPSCLARGSNLLTNLSQQLTQQKINIAVEEVQCLGYCTVGPNVRFVPNGQFFHHITDDSILEIISAAKVFCANNT